MKDISYYVGVGASAGGLEALESFFKAMPEETGLVFFVIQHLSPDYKSLMNELLARYTAMDIKIAEDNMEVYPNTIYLIPPRNNLSIFHGKLFLEEQKSHQHRISLPIDIFYRSLAKDQGKKSVGIVLSGTGSDGTLGVKAIKEAGGMVMVQDVESSKFDGMPRSSISTGIVDYILPPEEMPKALLDFVKHPSIQEVLKKKTNLSDDMDDITKICMILRDYGDIDFTHYKNNTMLRRIDRRLKINRVDSMENYLKLLVESDQEKEILKRELLIGVTAFFRDEEAYQSVNKNILPKLDYTRGQIRIWSAACSTGEEVYSLGILILEYLEVNNINCEVKIFATDVDDAALEKASIGYYLESIVADIDPLLVNKYFEPIDDGYKVKEHLRKTVVFAKHNLIKDPPFSKLDLLICRNVFIYLKANVQQDILQSFYYSLKSKGFLFMGSSESIGEMSAAFEPIDSKWKLFKTVEGYQAEIKNSIQVKHEPLNISSSSVVKTNTMVKFENLLMSVLENKIPPSIIIDQRDNIVHVIGHAGEYVRSQPGRFTNNFNSNLSKELALFVNNIIRRLKAERKDVTYSNVSISDEKDKLITISGALIAMNKIDFYLISFIEDRLIEEDEALIEVNMTSEVKERVKQLELEVQIAREGLQATIEELETSNEELQSSNEELIASNEELQSTNEELQSVNEELYTVNSEHQSKIEQLNDLNNDLNNLLKNTEVGALYLDTKLCIRKFTPLITKITNIRESDIGRPMSHITVMEEYSNIVDDLFNVIETLNGIEKEITTKDGSCYYANIRPYRSEYNSVDGVILTIVEITSLKEEESKNSIIKSRLELAMDISDSAWWEYNLVTGKVKYSDKKATMLGYSVEEFPDDVYEICDLIHPEDYEETMQAMRDLIEGKKEKYEIEYRIKCKDSTYKVYKDVGIVSERDHRRKPSVVVGTVINITQYRELESKILKLESE